MNKTAKIVICLSLVALGIILMTGCASTQAGDQLRSSLGLQPAASNSDVAQAVLSQANRAQAAVPGPWNVPLGAALALTGAILGAFTHKSGVSAGVDASGTGSPSSTAGPTAAPPPPKAM